MAKTKTGTTKTTSDPLFFVVEDALKKAIIQAQEMNRNGDEFTNTLEWIRTLNNVFGTVR